MGLDMYLSAKQYTSKYSNKELNEKLWAMFDEMEKIDNIDSAEIKFEVGYWRKANAIHKWFVDNCQGGKDECQDSYVSREKLKELRLICDKVLRILSEQKLEKVKQKNKFTKEEEENEIYVDSEEIEGLLPTSSGFFFGGTNYDEWYVKDLQNTIEIIDKCLKLPDVWDFEYRSSW